MKKLLITVILGLFLISFASALVQDNGIPYTDTSGSGTNPLAGMKILVLDQDIQLYKVTKASNSQASSCYILNSGGSVLYSSTFSGNVASFNKITLSAGTSYYIAADHFTGYSRAREYGVTFPIANEYINWTSGYYEGAEDTVARNIQSITINEITLLSPENSSLINTSDINFSWNMSTSESINNLSLYVDDQLQYFNSSGSQGEYNFNNDSVYDGEHLWYVSYFTDDINKNSSLYNFIIDTIKPVINIPEIFDDYGGIGLDFQLNWTVSDTYLDTCWFYNGTNNILNCSDNTTNIKLPDIGYIIFYANDTAGNTANETVTPQFKIFKNSISYNETSYETAYEQYLINITANSSLTSVNLNFNDTLYSMTNQGDGVWSYARDLPSSVVGNNSISFRFTYAGDYINSDTSYQDIQAIQFALCNATLTDDFINISFKDESNLQGINASVPLSIWEYYLGTGTQTKTYTFTNVTANNYYDFCATPDREFNINTVIQYQSEDYPQRIYDKILELTSTVTNTILYLLSSSDGIYVTFQVLGATDLPLSSAEVISTRIISGETVEVGHSLTDAAGTVTFWLNPDFQHNVTVSKEGYDTLSTLIYPTQSTYTINLGTVGTEANDSETWRGINIAFTPLSEFANANTLYDFKYTITTDYWSLDSWGYSLYFSNSSLIASEVSTLDSGGTLSTSFNTTNETKITMEYYYIVNSTRINGTRYWLIQADNSYSLKNLFNRISTYIDADVGGIKGDDNGNFAKGLISVLILVTSVGLLSYKYGVNNNATIMGMLFGIVLFLNSQNLIPNPDFLTGSVVTLGNVVVLISLLISIGFIFKEEAR